MRVVDAPFPVTTSRPRCKLGRAKRIFDIGLALICCAVFAPLALIIVILILFDSPGPIFFAQAGVGLGGQRFKMWKFRTMIENADARLAEYFMARPELQEEWNRNHKLRYDPRVTHVGWILRRSSLDELPQLWCVLRGEMSIVGPRPISPQEIPRYGKYLSLYTEVRPGLSGLWQVNGRNDVSYRRRVACDVYYLRHWSLWFDLVILVRTWKLFLGRGAY